LGLLGNIVLESSDKNTIGHPGKIPFDAHAFWYAEVSKLES